MNNRRSRPATGSVSLFPFLAVLICTMGSLIVLLVVVVQQSRDAAEQTVVAAETNGTEPPADPAADPGQLSPDDELADLRWQIETLQSSRETTQKQLQDAQLRLSMTEDQIRDLSQELDRLERRAQQIEAVRAQQLADQSLQEQKLQALQSAIAKTEQELANARDQAAHRKRRYAIVAHHGVHGTDRRPVFVECLSDRVVIQPEGIELHPTDFAHADRPDNPLAAAVRAAREYWLDSRVLNSAADAYPLLIVRPQGVDSYHGCRAALDGWDDDFGYELIPSDVELQFPPADPTLRQTMLEAIADARIRGNLPTPTRHRSGTDGPFDGDGNRNGNGRGHLSDNGNGDGNGSVNGSGNGSGNGNGSDDGNDNGSGSGDVDGGSNDVGAGPTRPGEFQPPPGSTPGGGADAPGDAGGNGAPSSPDDTTFAPQSAGLSFPGGAAQAPGQAGANGGPSFADHRGNNWALPSSADGSIGTSRPVVLVIRANQISLVAESGNTSAPQAFNFQSSVKEAIPAFVDALWNRIDTWGVAGPSAYWKPTLLVDVRQDGEAAFQEFVQLMKRSGLNIERRTGR